MAAPLPVFFERVDPDSAKDVAELKRQRALCGWGLDGVDKWMQLIREDRRNMYWIYYTDAEKTAALPEDEYGYLESSKIGPRSPDPAFKPIGHIALDWEDYAGEPSLASKEDRVCTIATFFILKSQQGGGLGSAVVKERERRAVTELNARAMTLNTFDGEKCDDPEWCRRAMVTRNNERWYARYGYVAYRRNIPRYWQKDIDGNDILLEAVYMRKELQAE